MDRGRLLRLAAWSIGGLFGLMTAALIVDSTGPNQKTDGTIISTRFSEGMTTNFDLKAGDSTIPIHTEIPGAWIATIDSPALGRFEFAVDSDTLRAGQRVDLEYHVGRLSGQSEVVGVRPQSEQFGEQ